MEGLRKILENLQESLRKATDSEATGTVKADVTLVGEQASISKVRSFSVVSDEPESSGGQDLGPTPLEYFLSSIGFCENVTFARNAALMGVPVEKLTTRVIGHWNRKGQFEIEGKNPSFTDITVEFNVVSSVEPEKVAEVAKATFRRCPMHTTISKATNVYEKLVVNGNKVEL